MSTLIWAKLYVKRFKQLEGKIRRHFELAIILTNLNFAFWTLLHSCDGFHFYYIVAGHREDSLIIEFFVGFMVVLVFAGPTIK